MCLKTGGSRGLKSFFSFSLSHSFPVPPPFRCCTTCRRRRRWRIHSTATTSSGLEHNAQLFVRRKTLALNFIGASNSSSSRCDVSLFLSFSSSCYSSTQLYFSLPIALGLLLLSCLAASNLSSSFCCSCCCFIIGSVWTRCFDGVWDEHYFFSRKLRALGWGCAETKSHESERE